MKKRDCTICVVKTNALISCAVAVFIFAYAKSQFSHDVAYIMLHISFFFQIRRSSGQTWFVTKTFFVPGRPQIIRLFLFIRFYVPLKTISCHLRWANQKLERKQEYPKKNTCKCGK